MKKICLVSILLPLGICLSSTTSLNAAVQWLPDALEKGLKFDGNKFPNMGSGGRELKCNSHSLDKCPEHASCTKCPYENKYKVIECNSGYRQEGQSCVCVLNKCSGFELVSIPENAEYTACEPGCGQQTKYKKTGCKQGYFEDNGKCVFCDKQNTACEIGYELDNTCRKNGVIYGDCVNCLETKCSNHYVCDGENDVPDGKVCECGGKKYYPICKKNTNPSVPVCPDGYTTTSCGDFEIEINKSQAADGQWCYQCKETSCDSEYKYTSENCPYETHRLCGLQCDDYYTECRKLPYVNSWNTQFEYAGLTFGNEKKSVNGKWILNCPDSEKHFSFYSRFAATGAYPLVSFVEDNLASCYVGDDECLKMYEELLDTGEASLNKDVNCGNLIINAHHFSPAKEFTLNGNGHTMTFEKPFGVDFSSSGREFHIKDVKIIHKAINQTPSLICDDESKAIVFDSGIRDVTNSEIYGDAALTTDSGSRLELYGTNYYQTGANVCLTAGDDINNPCAIDVGTIFGTLNIDIPDDKPFMTVNATLASEGIMNFNGTANINIGGEKSGKANICMKPKNRSSYLRLNSEIKKENIRTNYDHKLLTPVGGITIVPELCSEDIFNGEFWR